MIEFRPTIDLKNLNYQRKHTEKLLLMVSDEKPDEFATENAIKQRNRFPLVGKALKMPYP